VSDLPKFRLKVADTKIGSHIPITVLRDGKRIPITVTLSERPKDGGEAQVQPKGGEQDEPAAMAGIRVRELTAEEKTNPKVGSGVVVTDVAEGSAGDDAGLQPGDIIEQVGGKSVVSATVLTKMLKDAKVTRKHAALLV